MMMMIAAINISMSAVAISGNHTVPYRARARHYGGQVSRCLGSQVYLRPLALTTVGGRSSVHASMDPALALIEPLSLWVHYRNESANPLLPKHTHTQ